MSEALNNTKKKEIAHDYFKQGLSQKDIADKLGISTNTISRWAVAGNWREERRSITLSRQEILRGWQNQILEINAVINARAEGMRYATTSEADVMTKLRSNISHLEKEASLPDYVSVFRDVVEFFQANYAEKAKEVSGYLDIFIKSKL